ncbi:hypothetical protein Nepgr_024818 [Nepenthes gracilis]|uniref:t-SNARE coiled-coil homology domain-containing protein n=1 Tax=Nepenthes gracilis TaxID=150966 RepID=A0AAD3T4S4_NEPGR|nr:hypothetical protein Nepgr_024818 [Nepenthes gracilis]
MNDLFSSSSSRFPWQPKDPNSIQMTEAAPSTGGINLDKFFGDAETVKEQLKEIEELERKLKEAHEESKTLHNATAVKDLRSKMENDVAQVLKKAKTIKVKLEALDRSNAANRQVPGCGPGSSADRTRTSVVGGLRKNLREKMEEFQELREMVSREYRETVARRYFTVTGENPDEKTLDLLINTGESETFLQKAIQQQGRGRIQDTIIEIQERHDAVREIERNLKELHQVFLDMAVLVQHQGEQLDDIEAQVQRAQSYVNRGTGQLITARKHQKNSRKWLCIGIILLLVIILIVLFSVRPWKK